MSCASEWDASTSICRDHPDGFGYDECGVLCWKYKKEEIDILRQSVLPNEFTDDIFVVLKTKIVDAYYINTQIQRTLITDPGNLAFLNASEAGDKFVKALKALPIDWLPALTPPPKQAELMRPGGMEMYQEKKASEYMSLIANVSLVSKILKSKFDARNLLKRGCSAQDPVKDAAFEAAFVAWELAKEKKLPKSGGNANSKMVVFLQTATTPILVALGRQTGPASGEAIRKRIQKYVELRDDLERLDEGLLDLL